MFYTAYHWNPEKNSSLYWIDQVITMLFGADFFLKFFQEYQDKDTFDIIRSHKEIAKNYFNSGYLVLDFLATFPFDAINP